MDLLEKTDYGRVMHLLDEIQCHLAPFAVLNGVGTGDVYVDDASRPRSMLIWTQSRLYLAGDPDHELFNLDLRRFFFESLYPQAIQEGREAFILFYPNFQWQQALEKILDGKYPLLDHREHYLFRAQHASGLIESDWRSLLPEGFEIRSITPALLEDDSLESIEDLREEVVSEAVSREEFFQHRFGFCIVEGKRLAAWCLSEYNWQDRCEVGIATVEDFQRRGLATAAGRALIEHALAHGIHEIGWDCWKSNEPSAAAARKIGFQLSHEYPVMFAFFDPVLNLAVHGNHHFRQGQYPAAAAWYERAFSAGEAQAWAYWNAACANARIEENKDALKYLHIAHQKGFHDLERMQSSEHLAGIRGTAEFRDLLDAWYVQRTGE